MNALELEFLEYESTSDEEFRAYFDEDNKSCAWITFGTKYLNKLIYTLVKLVLNPFILLILHSIFSTIRKICTDGRQNFRKRRYTRPCIY